MGRGSGVRAASASSIEIDFYFRGVRCKERIKLAPTPRNLRYCENMKAEIENAISKGTFNYADYFPDSKKARTLSRNPGDAITVGEALDKYLQRAPAELQASTYQDYKKTILGHLVPEFGHLTLGEFRVGHVRDWTAKLNVSKKRLYNMLIPLRNVLTDAYRDGLIESNPLYGWYPKVKEELKEHDDIDPFSLEEIRALLDACTGQAKNLFQFAFFTGLRTSELIALKWGDVDFLESTVYVRRAKSASEIKPTKTARGRRVVSLLAPALQAITQQKKYTYLADEFVFHNPRTGEPWASDQPIRKTAWHPAIRRAGVRYRYPYQTRHTYASMLLTAGENPLWVANQMGHADTTMIFKRYGRWIPSLAPDAGDKVSKAWEGFGG